MRISTDQAEMIRRIVREEAGADIAVRLFGSRLDDSARGGDIDLLLESPRPLDRPALLGATVEAKLIRALGGRRVDVVLVAPNLRHQPIHDHARQGILL